MTGFSQSYRGRLAPSPTGLLHVGHARTFWIAAQRAAECGGQMILRNEDLDPQRCRPEFLQAKFEDLHWLGISWEEGPDCGGPVGPYTQSQRRSHYLVAWRQLLDAGMIYPCTCSRKDVAQAAGAPNDLDDEPVYSGRCRPPETVLNAARLRHRGTAEAAVSTWLGASASCEHPAGVNWRFRVPDGEEIRFTDLHLGPQRMLAFGFRYRVRSPRPSVPMRRSSPSVRLSPHSYAISRPSGENAALDAPPG